METEFQRFDFPRLRRRLLAWYRREGRELPWRNEGDPYRVWISEIMLQQTTVAAVVPYFERFLNRFPTVRSLAAAKQDDVLRLWEGLGYYSRARNLHKAAQTIVSEHAGKFPEQPDELQKLSGIGRYTAGAIASFAFDRPAPIVEANTLRLYSRLLGYEGDPRSSEGQTLLWSFAEAILPQKNAGATNQALMDLGATLCTPAEPNCPACPLAEFCSAFETGKQDRIPQAKAKVNITELQDISVAVRDGNKVLLRQRTAEERWAGLWDFPRWTSSLSLPKLSLHRNAPPSFERSLIEEVRQRTGYRIEPGPLLAMFKHSVTRYRIELFCFTAQKKNGRASRSEQLRWVPLDKIDDMPMSVTGRKFAKRLAEPGLFG